MGQWIKHVTHQVLTTHLTHDPLSALAPILFILLCRWLGSADQSHGLLPHQCADDRYIGIYGASCMPSDDPVLIYHRKFPSAWMIRCQPHGCDSIGCQLNPGKTELVIMVCDCDMPTLSSTELTALHGDWSAFCRASFLCLWRGYFHRFWLDCDANSAANCAGFVVLFLCPFVPL